MSELERGEPAPTELCFGIAENFELQKGLPVARQYEERLRLIARADELGFYGYHVSEHHNNPLGLAPSPLLYLSAVAQRTKRIRFGPLVLVLPTYVPFRLLEEICMLDQLSDGRLMVGVGRGVRPVEHEWHGLEPGTARERFEDSLHFLRRGLGAGRLSFAAAHLADSEFRLEPKQRPYPPFWYAGNLEVAAALGMSVIGVPWHGLTAETVETYWAAYHESQQSESPRWTEAPRVGSTRHVVVAETDAEAVAIARRAWPVHADNVWTVPFAVGASPAQRGTVGMNVGEHADVVLPRRRALLAGSPRTVQEALAELLDEVGPGHNYLVSNVQWGDISHVEALQSLELLSAEVIPHLSAGIGSRSLRTPTMAT